MSKVLKNQTGSPISIPDTGVSLAASPATYTIPPTDFLLWAASSDIITQIGSGNVIVSDGATNLSIADGTALIQGNFPSTVKITDGTDTLDITAAGRVSVDSIVGTIVLPTGASSSANQVIQTTALNSIDTKLTNNATSTLQTAGNASLVSIDTKLTNNATSTLQTAGNASLVSIDTKLTNNATSTLQTAGNASLVSIDAGIPAALGQTTMSASMPVTLASNQSALPITASEDTGKKTFSAVIELAAIGNNKSMFSIVNAVGSGVVVKIREIKLINSQTAPISGIVGIFRTLRISNHSAGTNITPVTFDTADSLNVNVTIKTNSTVSGEGSTALSVARFSTDDWGSGASDVESTDHALQTLIPLYSDKPGSKPVTIREGEGLTIKQTFNSSVGTFDIIVIFTEE